MGKIDGFIVKIYVVKIKNSILRSFVIIKEGFLQNHTVGYLSSFLKCLFIVICHNNWKRKSEEEIRFCSNIFYEDNE